MTNPPTPYPSRVREAFRLAKQKQRQQERELHALVNAKLKPQGLTVKSLLTGIVDGTVTVTKGEIKMETLINLTPHKVVVVNNDGHVLMEFSPSGQVARCTERSEYYGTFADVPMYTSQYGEVTGLPGESSGTKYIVSALVRTALPERLDLLSPGALVRSEDGQPVGCKYLVSNCLRFEKEIQS